MEWLTTGQMVDQLKVGEIAESQKGFVRVSKDYRGIVADANGEVKKLTGHFLTIKWRILPKYISFEEAMKVVDEGKTAYFHPNDNERMNCHKDMICGMSWFAQFTFKQLLEGKWTIDGEQNG